MSTATAARLIAKPVVRADPPRVHMMREAGDGTNLSGTAYLSTWREALDAALWAAEHPEDYPPARECPDHAWVQCLGCGRTVSDPAGIDLWNGYGSGPCGCDPDTTRSMWTRYDGTWTAILDGRVMDEGTWPDTNR